VQESPGESIGEYDMEDDFIDDEDFAKFVEGDFKMPKVSGYYINKVLPLTFSDHIRAIDGTKRRMKWCCCCM